MQSLQHILLSREAKNMSSRVSVNQKPSSLSALSNSSPVNTRVWMMFEEAAAFLPALALLEGEVTGIELATTDFLSATLPLLSTPLPRVWQRVEGGLAEPVREGMGGESTGGEHDPEAMTRVAQYFNAKTQLEITKPLQGWINALELVQGRMAELEQLHGELQKRNDKVQKSQRQAVQEHLRSLGVSKSGGAGPVPQEGYLSARSPGGPHGCSSLTSSCFGAKRGHTAVDQEGRKMGDNNPGDRPADFPVEQGWKEQDLDLKLKDHQRNLEAARQSFGQLEGVLFEQLSGLCRDAEWLKSYMTAQLLLLKEVMQESSCYLGPTKQSLPMMLMSPSNKPAQAVTMTSSGNEALALSLPTALLDKVERHLQFDRFAKYSRSLHHGQASSRPLEIHTKLPGGKSRPNTAALATAGPHRTDPAANPEQASGHSIAPVLGGWGDTGGEPSPFSAAPTRVQ